MVVADARDRVSFAQAAEQRLVARRACAAAGDRETAAGEDTGAGGDEKTAAGQAARESGKAASSSCCCGVCWEGARSRSEDGIVPVHVGAVELTIFLSLSELNETGKNKVLR